TTCNWRNGAAAPSRGPSRPPPPGAKPWAIRGFQLRPITAADRSLLERQMALESLPLQWRCHSHGAGWRLQPSGGTSAANPPRRAVQPRHGP
ncbi:MAG: hypothetical protein KGQ81_01870, partial [Cyanobacteria bacterium REEB498]|nr:hypothetical protein [Cyanobacteria bacterium REEB498]